MTNQPHLHKLHSIGLFVHGEVPVHFIADFKLKGL